MILSPVAVEHCSRFIDGWLPGAMFPSEVAWLLSAVVHSRAEVLIECGRQDGVSTEMLATFLKDTGTKLISIDFASDPVCAQRARERVTGLDVELVSGDLHLEVPRLLQTHRGKHIAILQDAAKGWEGLATLLASATSSDDVVMIAQHNLHLGHVTRSLFQHLAMHPCYIEHTDDAGSLSGLLIEERKTVRERSPNRPIDHTSLGVMTVGDAQRAFIRDSFITLRRVYRTWNPAKVVTAWAKGDYGYVVRLTKRAPYSLARFMAR